MSETLKEVLQTSWDCISPRDQGALLNVIGQENPGTNTVDDMPSETRGRLIAALRDGESGFSIQEYRKCRDSYMNRKPRRFVRITRRLQDFPGGILHSSLHE